MEVSSQDSRRYEKAVRRSARRYAYLKPIIGVTIMQVNSRGADRRLSGDQRCSQNRAVLARAAKGTSEWLNLDVEADITAIADAIRDWAFGSAVREIDPATIALRLGWRVQERGLSAAVGGLQAVLAPMLMGGFTIVVDPQPTPAETDSRCAPSAVRATRIAHEIGHALFYERGRPPSRFSPARAEEEHFCDAFATALLAS